MRSLLALLVAVTACSADVDAESDTAEGAVELAPIYLSQAPLTNNVAELYNKLNVLPSVVSGGAKVSGPGLFGIVCTHEACTLNWLQRQDWPSSQFILTGPVAKAIALALPEADRTYENDGVKFRCDVQKGGLLSADRYNCAFGGLKPTVQAVAPSVMITPNVELKEADARKAYDKYFRD